MRTPRAVIWGGSHILEGQREVIWGCHTPPPAPTRVGHSRVNVGVSPTRPRHAPPTPRDVTALPGPFAAAEPERSGGGPEGTGGSGVTRGGSGQAGGALAAVAGGCLRDFGVSGGSWGNWGAQGRSLVVSGVNWGTLGGGIGGVKRGEVLGGHLGEKGGVPDPPRVPPQPPMALRLATPLLRLARSGVRWGGTGHPPAQGEWNRGEHPRTPPSPQDPQH